MKTVISYLILFTFYLSIYGQGIDAKLRVIENSTQQYVVSLSLRTNDENVSLGNASIRIKYDSEGLTFPDVPIERFDYLFSDLLGKGYIYSVTSPLADEISVNIYNSSDPIVFNDTFKEIVKLKFTKIESKESYNFKFEVLEVYQPNSQKPLSCVVSLDNEY